ncbi:MAG: MBL fold metallo-hydrolase [Chloroflexi bacterium]|nr:MBL fold metallo-hydrolase [Chloroflexota bacterium]
MAAKIHVIDARTWVPRFSSAFVLEGDRVALIETGLSTSAEAIAEGVAALGLQPEQIELVLMTHLHLDHAGGAGLLARKFPRAQFLIHEMGVPRLADPTRLKASAGKALGAFSSSYGLDEMVPLEQSRISPVAEGDTFDLGGTKLTVIGFPGHAPHHLCFLDDASNGLFAGDGLGIYFPESGAVSLTSPAPNFDLQLSLQDVARARSLSPNILYYSHYGPCNRVKAALEAVEAKLLSWDETVLRASRQGKNLEAIASLIAGDMAADAPHTPKWFHNEMAKLYTRGYMKYHRLVE